MTKDSIAIIGCGNMGSAIAKALLENRIVQPENLVLIEKNPNQAIKALTEAKSRHYHEIEEYQGIYKKVILAIKPQDAETTLKRLAKKTDHDSLVISVMAGITLKKMVAYLGDIEIIRCMPNTPCQVRQGMSAYFGSNKVRQVSFDFVRAILEGMGKAIRLKKEGLIDAVTAISGSGPAYVFYLAEALFEGAIELGLDENQALILSKQTLLGAATLLDQSDIPAGELRKKVTSPGGTTEAALNHFKDKNLKGNLIEGFKKACRRSFELGDK